MLNSQELLSLVDKYGTPIYVIDESELENKQTELDNVFSILPVPVKVAYPYKANSIKNVLEYMHKRGRWAEVASEIELNLALMVGVEPKNIILNAPYKPVSLLKQAVAKGCRIHIDNEDELVELSGLVDETAITNSVDIGLRISTPGNTLWSRFGFRDVEINKAINIIKDNHKLHLIGLHTHRSSIANLFEYRHHIEQIFTLSSAITREHGIIFDYIDIGSGFAIDWPKPSNELNWSAPSLAEYAKIVDDVYRRSKPNTREIVIEPGRKSVASSGCFLTKIVNIKNRGEKKFIICDGALNFIPGAEIYSYRISRIDLNQIEQKVENSTLDNVLCGCLCDSLDILDPKINIANPQINQVLRIDDVGGYDIARSFVWQLPYPPVVWVAHHDNSIVYK